MERLTKKDIYNEGYEISDCGISGLYMPLDDIAEIVDKLGELEDIEEKLGFPLNILKPGQKVEFYEDNELYYCEVMGINIQNKTLMIGSNWSFSELPLNAYSRLWWVKKD